MVVVVVVVVVTRAFGIPALEEQTSVNISGDSSVALIIASREGEVDEEAWAAIDQA